MTEGKINRYVIDSSEALDDIVPVRNQKDMTVVDKKMVECSHNGHFVRVNKEKDGKYVLHGHCTDCDANFYGEVDFGDVVKAIEGEKDSIHIEEQDR